MADPLGTAASIIAIVKFAVEVTNYLKAVKEGQRDRRRLRDEIRSTTTILEMLQDRIEEGDKDDEGNDWTVSVQKLDVRDGPLTQFKVTLERLVEKLVPSTKTQKAIQSWKWPFDQKEIQDLLTTIERQKSLFMLALENDHFKLSQAIKKLLDEVAANVERVGIMLADQESLRRTKEFNKALDWLSPLKFWQKQADYISERHVGTGSWLFERTEFKGWLAGDIKSVWYRGIAGAGKTILAASVIDHLLNTRAPDVAVLFVYCNYSEQTKQTVANFMASLTEQLLRQHGTVPPKLLEMYKERNGSRPNLVHLSQLLRSLDPLFREIFVVVDALDECEDVKGTRTNLLLEVSRLPNLRLLCTSRDLSRVPETLVKATSIEIRASKEDLQKFLQDRLVGGGRLSSLIKGDTKLIDQISGKIIEKASGMFLLAKLHLESLSSSLNIKEIRNALQELPKEIDETYDKAMIRIHAQLKGDAELAKKVLCWTVFAEQPLQISTLQYFIAASETGPEDHFVEQDGMTDASMLVDVCAGMVTIDEKSNIIRLIHYTTQNYFQQYFQNHGATQFVEAQCNITRTCLKVFVLHKNLRCFCSNHSSLRSVANVTRKNITRLWKPYRYALQHWVTHAIKSPEDAVIDEILDVFGSSGLVWNRFEAFGSCALTFRCKTYRVLEQTSCWSYSDEEPELLSLPASTDSSASSPSHENFDSDNSEIHADYRDSKDSIRNKSVPELWAAASLRLKSLAERLLMNGAMVNVNKAAFDKTTALHVAAQAESLEVTLLLLDNGADVSATDEDGRTPLSIAARYGHLPTTLKLLENGADVNFDDWQDYGPLHEAVQSGSPEVVESLIGHGADVHRRDFEGKTPMELMTPPLEANPRLDDEYAKDVSKIISILLDHGADPNVKNNYTHGGLISLACFQDYPEVVKALLDHGEDVKQKDGRGDTLLCTASRRRNSLKTLELLLERGADINARGREERTALHEAIMFENVDAVGFLLSKGADISARNRDGKTAAELALEAKYSNWTLELDKINLLLSV